MDAIEFLKEKSRMCAFYTFCLACPLCEANNEAGKPCKDLERTNPEELVSTVEKWSKEHWAKTRQSEFLEMFPNARMTELGSLKICPADVDRNIECSGENCTDCRKKYWLEEVE